MRFENGLIFVGGRFVSGGFSVEDGRFAHVLADAADDVGVGAGQIGLHHVDAGGVIRLLERLERGQRDEILVPDLLLRGPAERFIDGAQAARDLVLGCARHARSVRSSFSRASSSGS